MKRFLSICLALILVLITVLSLSGAETAESLSVGDIITFGTYPQTAEGTDQTPIEWIVLDCDEENHKALLISRYGLDTVDINDDWSDYTWEKCTLRIWLNSEFLNKAFSLEEQSAILTTEVDNSEAQGFDWTTLEGISENRTGGNDTQDKIFLLSYAEANRYFGVIWEDDDSNNINARVAPTAYANARYAWANESYLTADGEPAGRWWLRSSGMWGYYSSYVSFDGSLVGDLDGDFGHVDRPAFWLNLESAILQFDKNAGE